MVLATLGTLLGYRMIHQVVEDPQVGPFNEQAMWQDIIPAMGAEEQAANAEYARECLQRIGNPNIEHRLQGIRVDLTAKNAIRLYPSIRDLMTRRGELPDRLLLTLAATLEVVLRRGLQDVHADAINELWTRVDEHAGQSLSAFTEKALAYLAECVHEPLDVGRVAPPVSDLLGQIRQQGLREVLARRYALPEPVLTRERMAS
jgi:tagaturonate reductase